MASNTVRLPEMAGDIPEPTPRPAPPPGFTLDAGMAKGARVAVEGTPTPPNGFTLDVSPAAPAADIPPPPSGFKFDKAEHEKMVKREPVNFGSVGRGWNRLQQAGAALAGDIGVISPETAGDFIASQEEDIAQYPVPEDVSKGLQQIMDARGIGGTARAIWQNMGVLPSVIGESLPMSLPGIATGVAGGIAGGPGAVFGLGAGSGVTEYAASLMDHMADNGYDPADPDAIAAALSNPEFMAGARDYAAKRGVAIGAFDALSAGLGGKIGATILRGGKTAKRLAAAGGAVTGVEAVGGAGGEAAAQLATEGEINPGSVALEGIAEIVPGLGEAAITQRSGKGAAPDIAAAQPEIIGSEITFTDPAVADTPAGPLDGERGRITAVTTDDLGQPRYEVTFSDGRVVNAGGRNITFETPAVPQEADMDTAPDGALDQPVADERGSAAAPAMPPENVGPGVSPPAVPASPAATPEERATLRRSQLTDDDIDVMSREELAAEVESAVAAGIKPSEADIAAAREYRIDALTPDIEITPEEIAPEPDRSALSERSAISPEGSRQRPVVVETPEQVEAAGERVNTEPSEAQKEAGNYAKAHLKVGGLDITIENPKGSVRSGTAASGASWQTTMPAAYGYVKRTEGADGDQVDVYVGDDPASKRIYVVDQIAPGGRSFDEHKAILGVNSLKEARDLYAAGFSDGRGYQRIGAVTPMSAAEFRRWLKEGDTGKPLRFGIEKLTEEGFPADSQGRVKRPVSLIEFMAKRGGIDDIGGNLRAMDAHRTFVPGVGRLVSRKGMAPDEARRAAVDAGYLQDAAAEDMTTSTVSDLYEAVRADMVSRDQFSWADNEWAEAYRADQSAQESSRREDDEKARVRDELRELGYTRDDEYANRVIEIALTRDIDTADAMERAAIEMDNEEDVSPRIEGEDIPFDTEPANAAQSRASPESRAVVRAAGEPREGRQPEGRTEASRAEAESGGESRPDREREAGDERSAGESAEERQPEEVTTETVDTEDGKREQAVIPGAERIPDKELAERKASQPMRAKAEQKEPGGLFSDEKDQTDLLDLKPSDRLSIPEAPPTDSAAFKRWFGDSKVVDENGKPLVVYHGTPDVRAILKRGFRGGAGRDGAIFFSSDRRVAETYADDSRAWDYQNAEPYNLGLYLSLQNPLIIDAEGGHWRQTEAAIDAAREGGHDGIIIRNTIDEYNAVEGEPGRASDVYAVFEPTQVKSAMTGRGVSRVDSGDLGGVENAGTFDPADPRIQYSTPDTSAIQPQQRADLSAIVQRVSGLDEIHFVDRIQAVSGAPSWGVDAPVTAAGMYSPAEDAITLSLERADRRTAYHEAFHRLQFVFLNDAERDVLSREHDRLREIVMTRDERRDQVAGMDPIEIEAEAFAIWSDQMDRNGAEGIRLHIGIRKVWNRIRDMVRRVRSYLSSRGLLDAESIFERARSGAIAQRGGRDRKRALTETVIDVALTQDGLPRYSIAERLPDVPARDVPGALVTGRISNALRAGVARMKGMSPRDRANRDDGETSGDYLHRKLVDYLHPLRMMQEEAGVPLNDLNDAYMNARLAEDAALANIQTMHDKYVTPMVDSLVEGNASLEELHRYLYATHAEERNRVVGLRNPEDSDLYRAATDPTVKGASGMSANEARGIISGMQQDREKFTAIRRAAADVRAMLDQSLKDQRSAGLISQESFDLLTTQWKNYVPLKGQDGMDDQGNWRPVSRGGFDVRGDEFKSAMGRFSEADNIIANAVTQSEQSILRQKKNDVGKAMIRFINEFDPKGERIAQVYWTGEETFGDITKAPKVQQRVIGTDGKVTTRTVPNPFQNKDDVLATKIGGKTYFIRFRDPKIGHAVKNLGAVQLDTLSKMVRNITVWQSIINTRANPAFTPINVIRDVQTGAVHLLDEGFSTRQIAGVVANVPKAWGALWRHSRGKAGNTEWDRLAKEYFDSGGKITFHGYTTMEESLAKLQKDIAAGVSGQATPKKVGKAILKFIGNLNDAGENGIRLAAYAAARNQQGRTAKQAAFLARDLTVDFKKHGEIGPLINSWYVFFNAALQGNYNIARRMARSKKVQAAVGSFIFAGMMQGVWNTLMAGEDDDGESYYAKMLRNEPYKLERQFVFFLPGSSEYVSFPLPYGYNAFHHLGVQGHAITTGQKDAAPAILDAARVAFDAFNPIGSGSIASMVAPTIADPAVEIIANENFFGSPIFPSENPFDQAPPPDSSKSFSSTHPAFKWIAEQMNEITGGSPVEPGVVDIHPDTLEHLWGFFTGGLGRFAAQSQETAARAVQGEYEPKKTPWVRSFYGRVDEDSQRSEYFRQREAVLAADGRLKDYAQRGRGEVIEDFQKRHAVEIQSIGAFKAAEKERRKLNKQRRRIEGDDRLSASDRKTQLERLDEIEIEIMKAARQAFASAREQAGGR